MPRKRPDLAERNTRHGQAHRGAKTPEYTAWRAMLSRCTDPKSKQYGDYGGRGITVCVGWLSFETFFAYMGKRPDGMSLDRFPNTNGNYEPGNCRWATKDEQMENRRCTIRVDGKLLTDVAVELGIPYSTLYYRFQKHGSVNKPVRNHLSRTGALT